MSNIETNEMETSGDDRATTDSASSSLANLQENFTQQQVITMVMFHILIGISLMICLLLSQAKISALKELVRQSEEDQGKNTASAQEKVRNIAQRLTHLKTKASRSRHSGKYSKQKLYFFFYPRPSFSPNLHFR